MEPKWLAWAKQLQAIAQAGLAYSKDVYDLERFEEIRKLSTEIMSEYTGVEQTVIRELFANETGYATPKVDVRAVVFHEGKLLMVQEATDGKWALPGGWGDIGLTPGEVAVKEVQEEAGLVVKASKLLGVLDKKCHPHPPSPYHVYKFFIQCEIVGGEQKTGIETKDIGFYAQEDCPALSIGRITASQIEWLFTEYQRPSAFARFD
ncbi:ADP-ribose pyrophosphatase YjhB, NUDIX family [Amphibacillus marinus]|uniref:ADP-ribose pyrophosphatase YjhB, NUDIX family n=1 Tax=Amphibacillus marinus TaxID=872970 RepID=A0A1H8TBQ8_9BACI|nr:NUDIX hydrolase [Amphibacillus marinus]SEO88332.1 ADP-ribose pyrophosphatase YjhB, NUDIX family [Amphibacillus marinus]